MVIPGDRLDFADDIGLFNLNKIKNKAVRKILNQCLEFQYVLTFDLQDFL